MKAKWIQLVLMLGLVAIVAAPNAFSIDDTLLNLPFAKKLALAKAGDVEAKLAVGDAYENGIDAHLDLGKAARWYREAALGGNLDAQFRLAKLLTKGAKGVPADKGGALKLLNAAAAHGNAQSQNFLGTMLQNGDGIAKDEKTAVVWYEKAANQDLAMAENNLGVMYLKGAGTPRDLPKAFALFEKAAQQGEGWALNNLGGMYEMGWATPKDIAKAKDYYAQAAAKGIAIAKKNMERLAAVN